MTGEVITGAVGIVALLIGMCVGLCIRHVQYLQTRLAGWTDGFGEGVRFERELQTWEWEQEETP